MYQGCAVWRWRCFPSRTRRELSLIWDWQTKVYQDSDSCGVCRKRFRANQTLDMIPLTDLRDEGEIIVADVHKRCATAYRREESEREAQIKKLQDEIAYLEYYASRADGRAMKGSITHDALYRRRRLRIDDQAVALGVDEHEHKLEPTDLPKLRRPN